MDGLFNEYVLSIDFAKPQEEDTEQINEEESEMKISDKIVKAKISNIDAYGNMTIQFSTPMITYGLNLTNINKSVCDIYIQPTDNWVVN